MLRAALSGSDPLLAALGRATAPITIRVGDSPPLDPAGKPADRHLYRRSARAARAQRPAAADGNSAGPAANAAAAPAIEPGRRRAVERVGEVCMRA